jgi:uncharacterized membrane protein
VLALVVGVLGWKLLLVLVFAAVGFLVGKYLDDQKKMEGEDEKDQPLP